MRGDKPHSVAACVQRKIQSGGGSQTKEGSEREGVASCKVPLLTLYVDAAYSRTLLLSFSRNCLRKHNGTENF